MPAAAAAAAATAGPRFQLHDCTVDLLTHVLGCLDARDRTAFALAHSYHLLVLHTWHQHQQQNTPGGQRGPLPVGLGGSRDGLVGLDRPRFLYPGERGGETVALVSYPRSGNSMLRGLLEGVTGVVTGSDTRPDRVLSRSLLKKGLRGEGVVDARAWVVKTHWPERYGYRRFPAQRAILLVRNPFDAINSYFNMAMTNTHEQTLKDSLYVSLGSVWEDMVRNEVKVWARFNMHWLTRGLPVLAVRYEDLLLHTEEMLVRIVSFLERTPPEAVRDSPRYMARIRKTAAAVKRPGGVPTPKQDGTAASAAAGAPSDDASPRLSSDPLHVNKPRRGGKIGASMRHYSPAQVEEVSQIGGAALRAFGYDPKSQGFPEHVLSMPPYERCVKFVDPALLSLAPGPAMPAAAAAAAAAPGGSEEPPVEATVNRGRQLRDPQDRFGRDITKLRHSLTDDDRCPLPTCAPR